MMEPRGETYGPFEVLERLGVGGMATVHRAIERGADGFERTVALKRLLFHLAEDADFVSAFVREAKLASLLRHDNIVKLYDLGRVGASYFISMEYIAGHDLRVILRHAHRVCGPPPVQITIALISQLLDALDYAHGQRDGDGKPLGIIHRDISPANLLISSTGHLKVIDFGIAKATFGHLMTHSGRIKGKLPYMAPEALAGRELDGRSDLFAASVIAHELLTATPLFAARTDLEIIDRLENMQAPPPSARNPSCPAELDEIVRRGLAKVPDERWSSAAEMRDAVVQLAIDRGLLVSSRDVASWLAVEIQTQAPAASSRLALPLPPPPNTRSERRPAGSAGSQSDEVMDIVWGASGQRSMPVILDEIPDAAAKPLPSAVGPTPSGWALGTGRQSQPLQRQVTLDEVVRAARHTEAVVMAALATRRPRSLGPLLVACVAVSLAGAGVAWLISSLGRAPPEVAVPKERESRRPARAQPATDGPRVAPIAERLAPAPAASAVVVADDLAEAGDGAGDDGAARREQAGRDESDASADRALRRPRFRRARSDRERDRERARGRGRGGDAEAGARGDDPPAETIDGGNAGTDGTDVRPATGAPDRDEPADEMPVASTIEATGPRRQDLPPLPVAVGPPGQEAPGPATGPALPGTPFIVSASRAQRESGNVQPIRFPSGEQLPTKLTAKLCIDARGVVTSVVVLSAVSVKVRFAVEQALLRWRYRPVLEAGAAVAACFATAFPVQLH